MRLFPGQSIRRRFIYWICAISFFLPLGAIQAASHSKLWKQHRDAGRKSVEAHNDETAEVEYLAALKEAETFRASDIRLIQTLEEIAKFYVGQRKYLEAERHCERAVELQEPLISLTHAELPALLVELAQIYTLEKKYWEAEKTYARAQACAEKCGSNSFLSVILAGQGQLACEQKQFRKAEEHLKAAITVHESMTLHLSAHAQQFHYPLLASYHNSLGIVLRSLHKFAEAEKQFLTAVKIYADRLGKTAPELIPPSFNLAALYADQQDWAKASSFFDRVKGLAQKNASATHPIWADIKQFEAGLQKYANAASK